MLLSEAIKIYMDHLMAEQRSSATIKGYHRHLMLFCLYSRNPLIQLITSDQIDLYFKERSQLGWKRNSMVAPAMALRKFFEYWKRKGYPVLDYQMLPIVHKENVEPRVASQESLEKVLAQCPDNDLYGIRNRAIILLLTDTGMRVGEMCTMNTDIDQKCEVIEENGVKQYSYVIRSEKRRGAQNSHRRVFWYEDTHTALVKWQAARAEYVRLIPPRDPDALFISTQNSHGKTGSRMTNFSVGLVLRNLSAKAGIPSLNAHSMRHKFGNDAADAGANNSNISDLMGHASLSSSFVYTHLRGKQLGDAHRKVKRNMAPP
jgi:site-specific recombinase XerD